MGILQEKNKRNVVIICHGFTANKDCNFIPPLSEYLSKNDLSTLRFDFTGDGESEGELSEGTYTQKADDLGKAIDFLNNLGYKKIFLIGHSMGGSVSILRSSIDKRIDLLVAIAAVAYPGRKRLTKEQIDDLDEKGYFYWNKYKINKSFIDDASGYDLTKFIKKVRIPILIIHGDRDEVVLLKEASDLYKNANEPKGIKIIKNANHDFSYSGRYKNQEEKKEYIIMKQEILKFIGENIKND